MRIVRGARSYLPADTGKVACAHLTLKPLWLQSRSPRARVRRHVGQLLYTLPNWSKRVRSRRTISAGNESSTRHSPEHAAGDVKRLPVDVVRPG